MSESPRKFPDHIPDEITLEELLTRPEPDMEDGVKHLKGDLMILGAAGKMGVSLSILAQRALRGAGMRNIVTAVSRFSDHSVRKRLEEAGIKTIACDLLNWSQVSELPNVDNVIYMAGRKFGTQQDQELSWAVNVLAPGHVARHFSESNIVVFSTGCVYPLVGPPGRECTEETAPDPVGEYAQSCLGRERIFSYYSRIYGTRICMFRLNYAHDLRYGILYDIGIRVFKDQPVDLSVSHFNCIWQGDANRMALLSLKHCSSPPQIINVTGTELVSVRETAEKFGRIFNKKVKFTTMKKASGMYLSDASKSVKLFGRPRVPADKLIEWQGRWIADGGRSLNKPTHFEETGGEF